MIWGLWEVWLRVMVMTMASRKMRTRTESMGMDMGTNKSLE